MALPEPAEVDRNRSRPRSRPRHVGVVALWGWGRFRRGDDVAPPGIHVGPCLVARHHRHRHGVARLLRARRRLAPAARDLGRGRRGATGAEPLVPVAARHRGPLAGEAPPPPPHRLSPENQRHWRHVTRSVGVVASSSAGGTDLRPSPSCGGPVQAKVAATPGAHLSDSPLEGPNRDGPPGVPNPWVRLRALLCSAPGAQRCRERRSRSRERGLALSLSLSRMSARSSVDQMVRKWAIKARSSTRLRAFLARLLARRSI